MAPTVRVQTDGKEPVGAIITGQDRLRLTGLTNIKLFVRRLSDSLYLDWSDNTFKVAGSISSFYQVLAEQDSVSNPGFYHLDNADHPGGFFDFSKIANKTADDIYHFEVIQDGAPQTALNVPQAGEVKEGSWLDFIDQAISDNATPAEVQAELRAIRLHQLVSVNPGAVSPGTGTYIKQIIDSLAQKPSYVLLQTYSYNQTADRLEGIIWVESGNLVLNDGSLDSCTVRWFNKEGTEMWSVTDAAPDAQGFFKVEKLTPGLVSDQLYYATAEIDITGYGTVSGGKGNFTF